jgi:hypothetical protein
VRPPRWRQAAATRQPYTSDPNDCGTLNFSQPELDELLLTLNHALGTTLEENIAMIGDSIAYLLKHFEEVIYDAEHFFDGYKRNPDYAMRTLLAAEAAGAHCLVLCDTNGGCVPGEVSAVIREVKRAVKAETPPATIEEENGGRRERPRGRRERERVSRRGISHQCDRRLMAKGASCSRDGEHGTAGGDTAV